MADDVHNGRKRARSVEGEGGEEGGGLPALRAKCAFLEGWFGSFGGDKLYEIEAKLKDADAAQFAYIKQQLDSFPGWADMSVTDTTDYNHVSKIRGTVRGAQRSFLLKQRVDNVDVCGDGGQLLRFTVSTEQDSLPPGHEDPVDVIRLKRRYTYNRKHEFVYDLTEVQSGRTVEEARGCAREYEVELEWVGQGGAEAFADAHEERQRGQAGEGGGGGRAPTPAAALAEKFLMKAQDLVEMANRGRAAAAAVATGGGGGGGLPSEAASADGKRPRGQPSGHARPLRKGDG